MKSIKHTVTPPGYADKNGIPKGFNRWQKSIQKEIDKIRNTDLHLKLKA